MKEILYIVGQALSLVAVVLGFVSFQMKSAKGILVFQIITASVFALHYLLIGVMTAVVLNVLAAVQCLCYYFRNKRGGKSPFLPALFAALVLLISILTWQGLPSVFIMIGSVANAIALAFSDAGKTRAAMLIKTPLCLIYNILVFSVGGIVYEIAVLISSVLGLIRDRREVKGAQRA